MYTVIVYEDIQRRYLTKRALADRRRDLVPVEELLALFDDVVVVVVVVAVVVELPFLFV